MVEGLWRELRLTPKPGLVDLHDAGSHPDLSYGTMARSIPLVDAALRELAASAGRGEPLAVQVAIARRAEQGMLARLGGNTHRGALFLGGVLLIARDRAGSDDEDRVRAEVRTLAPELSALVRPDGTHGEAARRRYRVRGVLGEVERGLPSVFEVAVPVFRRALERQRDGDAAAFAMLAELMQTVEDTTALHRCGRAGLARIRRDGAALARLVTRRAHVPFLAERNELYRRLHLTMGGVADLLAMAFAWLGYRGELAGGLQAHPQRETHVEGRVAEGHRG